MPHPKVIRGGLLFAIFRSPEKAEVWSPARADRIVGVPTEWNGSDTEFVEPSRSEDTGF